MVSYRIPYPLTAGFRIRIFNEAKYLKSMGHEIDLVYTGKSKECDRYRVKLEEVFNHIECFEIKKKEVFCNLFTHTLTRKKPFQVSLYWNREMNSYIQKVEKQYDFIIGNSIRNAEYLILLPTKKVILDFHDAISYNYLNLIKNIHGVKKIFYQIERKLLVQYECDITRKIEKKIIISVQDKEYLKGLGADVANTAVIPVAVRDDIYDFKDNIDKDECAVCFLGKMSYQPNADAVIWFAENVFRPLKSSHSNIKFYVLGIEPTSEVRALQGDGIEITGFLENPYEIIKKCMAMVVPIRNGAGMQNKILESMVVGTPCVISSIAEEGLNGKKGEDYLVADSALEYIASIEYLIHSPNSRKRVSENASRFVKQYTWIVVKNMFENILKSYGDRT